MTPLKKEFTSKSYAFGSLDRRAVVADFSGGQITTDGGVILIGQMDQHYRLSERIAACFSDGREASRVQHELKDIVAQRLYGLVQGYEDLNDHDTLRHDPMFGVAVGKLESEHARCAPLAGKSTLNRLEQAAHVTRDLSAERYVKFSVDPQAMANLLVSVSLEQVTSAPKSMILDMDVTNDEIYGNQAEGFFNGYYDQVCYAPLLIFWGHRLLSAKLRPSNVDPAAGALDELKRLVPLIRQRWPQVRIIVRGDSAYSREDIMAWCEAQPQVDYVVAHASNSRLNKLTHSLEARAKAAYDQQRQEIANALAPWVGEAKTLQAELDTLVPPQVWYQTLYYQTQESWSCQRRVVCKLTYDAKGPRRHFVVTSFDSAQVPTGKLHADYYCPRGDMENRIKEHQLDLFSDRTSTHDFESNQLRVWFSSFAYVLMQALRHHALRHTDWAQAQCGTIRLKLLKVAAQIHVTVRRVRIAFCSTWAGQSIFDQVYQHLQKLPRTG
jgi:Transposase DDE domain group 1